MSRWIMTIAIMFLAAAANAVTHEQVGVLGARPETQGQRLSGFCLDADGNLVIADQAGNCVRIVTPDDTLKARWGLDFAPQAVSWRGTDRTVLVAGSGRMAVLDETGAVVATAKLPRGAMIATAVSSSGDDVFVTVRAARTGYSVFRMDRDLGNPKEVISRLRGCCGQMDVIAHDGKLYVAANCDFEVGIYDRDGQKKGAITKPKGATFFDGCCEPKNVCMGPDGTLYVAESARAAVNRFSTDGKHLGVTGIVSDMRGCMRVTVRVSSDGSRVYMLDTQRNVVRVLAKK